LDVDLVGCGSGHRLPKLFRAEGLVEEEGRNFSELEIFNIDDRLFIVSKPFVQHFASQSFFRLSMAQSSNKVLDVTIEARDCEKLPNFLL
jgi:hypothetical protein